MTAVGSIRLTADQYLILGEDPPGTRLELVDGGVRGDDVLRLEPFGELDIPLAKLWWRRR